MTHQVIGHHSYKRGGAQDPAANYLLQRYPTGEIPQPILRDLMTMSRLGATISTENLAKLCDRREQEILQAAQNPKPKLRRIADPTATVYYIRFDRLIKIGATTNLETRLADLPHDELLATETGGLRVEQQRHKQFAKYRYKGEWFRNEGDLAKHIETLARR